MHSLRIRRVTQRGLREKTRFEMSCEIADATKPHLLPVTSAGASASRATGRARSTASTKCHYVCGAETELPGIHSILAGQAEEK